MEDTHAEDGLGGDFVFEGGGGDGAQDLRWTVGGWGLEVGGWVLGVGGWGLGVGCLIRAYLSSCFCVAAEHIVADDAPVEE